MFLDDTELRISSVLFIIRYQNEFLATLIQLSSSSVFWKGTLWSTKHSM